ncbi:MAG: carbohydrate-binding protein, partial [Tepidisphaeraceae bacterium]
MRRRNRQEKGFARLGRAWERLEDRRLLAAHIVGNPTNFATIQAAVNAATPGATVTVDPGTYNELVFIDKAGLSVLGSRSGTHAGSNTRGVNEAIVRGFEVTTSIRSSAFVIGADDVTVDGFTVQEQSSAGQAGAGIVINPQKSGARILNNIIQNNMAGLYLANFNAAKQGLIRGNVFRANNNPGADGGRGILTHGGISGGNLTNVLIDDNWFISNRGTTGTTGVEAAISLESRTLGSQTNLTITNNVFDKNGTALMIFNASNVIFNNNTITDNQDVTSAALRVEGGVTNLTARFNSYFENEGISIQIDEKGFEGVNSSFNFSNNNFFNNDGPAVSIDAGDFSGTLNLENCYWGHAAGPGGDFGGGGDEVNANGNSVDIAPFLTAIALDAEVNYSGEVQTVTSQIQIEDFNHGSQGIAYNDTTAGNGPGSYRPVSGVDILFLASGADAGFYVTATKAGEWLEYLVTVPQAGTYTLDVRLANNQTTGGTFHVEIDGANVTGSMSAPNTNGIETFTTLTKTGVALPAGVHVLRLALDANGNGASTYVANFNWLTFTLGTPTPPPAAPNNLTAAAISTSDIKLDWADNSTTETGFKIERSTDGVVFTEIFTTATGAITHTDTGRTPGTTYHYRVRATNSGVNSAYSNTASAVTSATITPLIAPSSS